MPKSLTLFNDPIHGVMVFEEADENEEKELREILRGLCDHEYFQRLRRIKQLGCSDLVFPGAVHTRFNHSLGVCYLAAKIANKIGLEFDEKKKVMIAALLHDVGHGPFSHAFERLFEKNKITHDDQWITAFLNNYAQPPLVNKKFRNEIEALISSSSDITTPENLILLRDVISSNLDADRLDYLLRDSHFCGVPYGKIDLEWILSCIVKIKDNTKTERLAISRKGIGALEDFLCARRLMTRNIYYHGKVKAAEYYIYLFLYFLTKQINDPKSSIMRNIPTFNESNLGRFLTKAYPFIIEEKVHSKKQINTFVSKTFKYYSQLTDDDIWVAIRKISHITSKGDCEEIAKALATRKLPECYALNPARIGYARKIVDDVIKKFKMKKWKAHIEKLDMVSYKHEKSPILISEINGGYSDIFHESNLLNFLSDKKEYSYFIFIADGVDKKAKKEIVDALNKAYCFTAPQEIK